MSKKKKKRQRRNRKRLEFFLRILEGITIGVLTELIIRLL